MSALVVNLFGGPGSGKSTTAAEVFVDLKKRGINAELASEYAKDLVWEKRWTAMDYQPYIFAKQAWRIERLMESVDVIVTDSPVLLSIVYGGRGATSAFAAFCVETFKGWRTANFFIDRGELAYAPQGRRQNEESANAVDKKIRDVLNSYRIPYRHVPVATAAREISNSVAYKCEDGTIL